MGIQAPGPRNTIPYYIESVTSGSPLGSETLWTYAGGIEILAIWGVIETEIQAQTTNTKLSVKNDALATFDICANGNLNGATVGTLLHITDNPANALQQHVNGIDTNGNALTAGYPAIAIATGVISVTYSAGSSGVICWYLMWRPITNDGRILV